MLFLYSIVSDVDNFLFFIWLNINYKSDKIEGTMNRNENSQVFLKKEQQNGSSINKGLQFALTAEQHLYLQHYLPKHFSLLEQKAVRKQKKQPNIKSQDPENVSLVSGNDTQDPRTKRQRSKIKKIDRYLEEDLPRQNKRQTSEKIIQLNDELKNCQKVLNMLKKHSSAVAFLQPVNPETSGAINYYQIVTDPMDLSTVEKKLKDGIYCNEEQFYEDINKIWRNSYTYNQKTSKIYKFTTDMDQYCIKIRNNLAGKANSKDQSRKKHIQEKTIDKKNFYERLKRLPELAVEELMNMLSEIGNYNKNKIELDFQQLDQQTLKEVQDCISAVQTKYRLYEKKINQKSDYDHNFN